MVLIKRKFSPSVIPLLQNDALPEYKRARYQWPTCCFSRFISCVLLVVSVTVCFMRLEFGLSRASEPKALHNIVNIAVDMELCQGRMSCTDWKIIRDAWQTPEYYMAANEAIAEPTNQWALQNFIIEGNLFNFVARVRDPKTDAIISASLLTGKLDFDRVVVQEIYHRIRKAIVRRKQQFSTNDEHHKQIPIMLDIGANIGYMTSIGLASGARVISFEPMRANLGCLLATVRANGWQHHSDIFHNAVSNEPSIVNMEPTNIKINMSNGHVTNSVCQVEIQSDPQGEQRQYGMNFMETVTVDQVMGEKYMDENSPEKVIDRIDFIKIDVETFEVNVIEGMIRTLCHVPIDCILMEVEYIKNHKVCNEEKMHEMMKKLGFGVEWNEQAITNTAFKGLPTNIMYVQQSKITGLTPFEYFKNDTHHPCKNIPPFLP